MPKNNATECASGFDRYDNNTHDIAIDAYIGMVELKTDNLFLHQINGEILRLYKENNPNVLLEKLQQL